MLPADFPRRFFNPLTSKHRGDYIHILLAIESVLEQAKRIALSRTSLLSELRRVFQRENYTLDVSDEEDYDEEPSGDPEQDNLAFTIRLLLRSGWIDIDESGDYASDFIFVTSYGKKLTVFLKDLTRTEDQTGHVINTYNNLRQIYSMPDSGFVCIQNAYESTQRLLTNIEMMYSKIKKFYTAALANTKPEELLESHLYGYVRDVVDKLIFPIKVDDSVDRFKGPILETLFQIESDTGLLDQVITSAMQTKRVQSKDDGWTQTLKMLSYIKYTFDDIESYIQQLDEKNQTYVRITRQKLSYMLSMDTSVKGNIIAILRNAKDRPENDWRMLDKCINLFDVKQVMDESFYHPRKRHIRSGGEELLIDDSGSVTQEEIDAVIDTRAAKYTTAKVNDYIQLNWGMQESISAGDITLAQDDDYLMAIFFAMNSTDRRSTYLYEASGDMLRKGEYGIPEFTLRQKGGR